MLIQNSPFHHAYSILIHCTVLYFQHSLIFILKVTGNRATINMHTHSNEISPRATSFAYIKKWANIFLSFFCGYIVNVLLFKLWLDKNMQCNCICERLAHFASTSLFSFELISSIKHNLSVCVFYFFCLFSSFLWVDHT